MRTFIDNLETTFNSFMDFSSIDPTLLNMSSEDIRVAITKILVSFSISFVKL
jgi:hypothetical protein